MAPDPSVTSAHSLGGTSVSLRDLKLEHVRLILENLDLQDRVVDLTLDNHALRETLHACVGALHRSQVQLARYQHAMTELSAGSRRFRATAEAA